jgi:hypothetical protein
MLLMCFRQLFPLQAKIETDEARMQQIESQMDGLRKIVASTNQHASTKDLVRELNEKLATEEEVSITANTLFSSSILNF